LPYFEAKILPVVKAGKAVLVAAHGNSLRSVVMHLDQLTREQVLELNLGTGVPIVYEIDAEGKMQRKRVL
jgi:2,3-bisphosphoglycerate-dependent phosphoglycerate mutase